MNKTSASKLLALLAASLFTLGSATAIATGTEQEKQEDAPNPGQLHPSTDNLILGTSPEEKKDELIDEEKRDLNKSTFILGAAQEEKKDEIVDEEKEKMEKPALMG